MQQVLATLPQLVDFSIVRLGPERLEPIDFLLDFRLFTFEAKAPEGPNARVRGGRRTGRRGDR
jgi:hypothetical protein